jgi:FMN reductase
MTLVIGIGGTTRPSSTSECALRTALDGAREAGAETLCLVASDLDLPHYDPKAATRSRAQDRLVEAFRAADGVIISSPGYHGAISGLVKNALDHAEDLVNDERVYFSDLPIGCIGVAYGGQAAVSVMTGLRQIAHALRGFPTPYGAAVVASPGVFDDGRCVDPAIAASLRLVGRQVATLADRLRVSRPVEALLSPVEVG